MASIFRMTLFHLSALNKSSQAMASRKRSLIHVLASVVYVQKLVKMVVNEDLFHISL